MFNDTFHNIILYWSVLLVEDNAFTLDCVTICSHTGVKYGVHIWWKGKKEFKGKVKYIPSYYRWLSGVIWVVWQHGLDRNKITSIFLRIKTALRYLSKIIVVFLSKHVLNTYFSKSSHFSYVSCAPNIFNQRYHMIWD